MQDDQPTARDLQDPAFLQWIDNLYLGGPVEPDVQDYDWSRHPSTAQERAEEHHKAQARKLVRLWKRWKAGAN